MKLKQIKKIENYKSFKNFTWGNFFETNDNFSTKANIIYGENGSGKSSIVALLKSVSNNKEMGEYQPAKAHFVFDDKDRIYLQNEGWNERIKNGEILFFDREFINKNVHLGHKRDTTYGGQEQNSAKMIIEFDSEAIKLRADRDEIKKVRDDQNKKLKDFESANAEVLTFTLTNEEELFYKIYKNKRNIKKTKAKLEETRSKQTEKLKANQELRKKTDKIQNEIKELSVACTLVNFSNYQTYKSLFNFNLEEQAHVKAELSLVNKIKTHKEFFESGFEIEKENKGQCPFCQSTDKTAEINKIIDLYNQIYDETYKKQKQQFEILKITLLDEISQIIQTVLKFDLNKIFFELKKLDQNYKISGIYTVEEEETYKKPTIQKISELQLKISKLISPSDENIVSLYRSANIEFKLIMSFFKKINNLVKKKNKLITQFRIDNTSEKINKQIDLLNEEISKIDWKLRFINEDKIKIQKAKENKEKEKEVLYNCLTELKEKYTAASNAYERYCTANVFSNLLSKIQNYFKKFDFNFQLELKQSLIGNKTESPFAFTVLDSNGNNRNFEDGLSEGELQILSLCFFFAFLDIQQGKTKKIIVFDDPITSLDNNNLSYLVNLIAEKKDKFSQIFVFTHHKVFFKFLRKRLAENCKEYNLIRNKDEFGGSFLCKSCKSNFVSKLKNFETCLINTPPEKFDVELKIVEYGQYLRYEVENYIKNKLLYWNATRLTDAVEGVKRNKKIDNDNLDKIKDIYSFCNWTTSHVGVGDDHGLQQLKAKIADFIKIIE